MKIKIKYPKRKERQTTKQGQINFSKALVSTKKLNKTMHLSIETQINRLVSRKPTANIVVIFQLSSISNNFFSRTKKK
jgi:hypothetical protein